MDVARKVAQSSAALPDVFEIHIPLFRGREDRAFFRGKAVEEFGVLCLERGFEKVSEATGQRLVVHKKVVLLWSNNGIVIRMIGGGRDDDMNVRVVLHLTPPGVEDTSKADACSFCFGGDDLAQGNSTETQDKIVEDFGVGLAKGAQLGGKSEGDHEVGHGQEFGFLLSSPDLLVERPALGATAVVAAMVSVVMFAASLATIEAASHLGSAARQSAPHRPVMGCGQVCRVRPGIGSPVLIQHLYEIQRHALFLSPGSGLGTGQGREGGSGRFLTQGGEVEIHHRGLERTMTQVGRHLTHGSPRLEHVGGETVAQSVGADFLVGFGESALRFGNVNGGPDRGLVHVIAGTPESFAQGSVRTIPAPPGTREKPFGIAVRGPEAAQTLMELRGDGDFTVLAALPFNDANDESLPIDILGLDVEGLAQAQTALVDDGKVSPVSAIAEGSEQETHLFTGENIGKGFVATDFDLLPDIPLEIEVIAVEGAQGANRLVNGAALELSLFLQVEEKVEDPAFA